MVDHMEQFAKSYPNTVEVVKQDLEKHYVIYDMSLQSALFLGELNRDKKIDFVDITQHFEFDEL